MAPAPEHHVTRIEGVPEPVAPPSLPPAEIIQAFSKKEETYQATRPQFSYRKTIHIQEFGPDGRPSGEYLATYDAVRTGDGKFYERAVGPPQSSLQYLSFEPEDAEALTRVPAYPVTASQLSKYDVRYLNTEKVDEVDCYIFQVKPKSVERQKAYFDGLVWVDAKYLEVVKTYGKWVTDLGDTHSVANLPFSLVGGVIAAFFAGGVLSLGSLVGFVTLVLRRKLFVLAQGGKSSRVVAVQGVDKSEIEIQV